MKKKTLGWGYRVSDEPWEEAISGSSYGPSAWYARTKKQILDIIRNDRKNGYITGRNKAVVFKVLLEIDETKR